MVEGDSDSKSLDGALELLVHAGWPLPQAVMALVPEAWEHAPDMDPARRAFYEYHSAVMEPWDGPACIAFTDGKLIGAVLDRNGLRPARYTVTKDDLVIMASEAGVCETPPENEPEAAMIIAAIVGFAVTASFVSLDNLEPPYYIVLIGAGALKIAPQYRIHTALPGATSAQQRVNALT